MYREWRQEEIDFILHNVDSMTYSEMARKLGRTGEAVRGKYRRELSKHSAGRRTSGRKTEVGFLNRIMRYLS